MSKRRDPIDRVRVIVLAFPETTERETWGHPTFRVRDKLFAGAGEENGRPNVTCKAADGVQAEYVSANPKRFHRPPYVGRFGWLGICLDGGVDWDEVEELLIEAYCLTAPKKLAAVLVTERAP